MSAFWTGLLTAVALIVVIAKCTVRTAVSFGDADRFQVKASPGRQGFCVGERSTPPRNELAAVVTRSHPVTFEQTAEASACG